MTLLENYIIWWCGLIGYFNVANSSFKYRNLKSLRLLNSLLIMIRRILISTPITLRGGIQYISCLLGSFLNAINLTPSLQNASVSEISLNAFLRRINSRAIIN